MIVHLIADMSPLPILIAGGVVLVAVAGGLVTVAALGVGMIKRRKQRETHFDEVDHELHESD